MCFICRFPDTRQDFGTSILSYSEKRVLLKIMPSYSREFTFPFRLGTVTRDVGDDIYTVLLILMALIKLVQVGVKNESNTSSLKGLVMT